MDHAAARIANILVGNGESAAVLEMHYPAAEIEFEDEALSIICGADMRPELDGSAIENWRPFVTKTGSVLRFKGKKTGNRSYLAVGGGFQVSEWLGSASTNLLAKFGGIRGRRLEAGQRIEYIRSLIDPSTVGLRLSNSLVPSYSDFPTVRIVAGAEFERLSKKTRGNLLDGSFGISADSDRMGYRLKGEAIELDKDFELVSSAVDKGTIQLLPNGQLILLMADHQTTGGYPRVGHVISADMPIAAQLGPGDKITFDLVTIDEAQKAICRFEFELNKLKWGCRLRRKIF